MRGLTDIEYETLGACALPDPDPSEAGDGLDDSDDVWRICERLQQRGLVAMRDTGWSIVFDTTALGKVAMRIYESMRAGRA